MAVPKKRQSSHPARQAPGHAPRGEAAPQRVPALPQPAPSPSRLPGLRHVRRARGDLARDRRSRLAERPEGSSDDQPSPSTAAAPSGGPTRSSPALAPPPLTGSRSASSATRRSSRRSTGSPGVELIEAADAITNDEDPVGAVRGTPNASIVLAPPPTSPPATSDALASAGPTGATMTAALFALQAHAGRPPARRSPLQLLVARPRRPPDAAARRRRQRRGPAHRPGPVRLPRRGLQRGGARGHEARASALLSVGEESKKGTADVVERARRARGRRGDRLSSATSRAATCSATPPT